VTDRYAELVRAGLPKVVATRLGLPRPAQLRRIDPASVDDPLVPGPVLLLSADDAESRADADVLAAAPGPSHVEVRRESDPGTGLGAVVVVLTGVSHPDDLAEPFLALGAVLRDLAPGGRVITVSRPPRAEDEPEVAAVREAIEGVLRSIAMELRGGSTGNGIVLSNGVGVRAPSVAGALRFFLSARSAFVSGQMLEIGTNRGDAPADWSRPLEGQVAVVTGAARGIGAEIARLFARDGAHVVAVDLPASGEGLAAVTNEVGGLAVQLDITASDATQRLLDHVLPRFGRIDTVIHNAGTLRDRLLANMKRDRWDVVMAVNLVAQLEINDGLLAADAFGPHPRLVSLASTSGIAGNRGQTNYAASKAGIIGMTRALAPLLAERGGTANAVAPGFIETDMTASIPTVAREIARRANSLRQGGLPVDVAEAVAFLASPQAGGVNGRVLRVCGQYVFGR
jgi:3-oxoacyl-[acyl-carrier protein] reductase